jgi:site-specific recombinase XerD
MNGFNKQDIEYTPITETPIALPENVDFEWSDNNWNLSFRETRATTSCIINFSKFPIQFQDVVKKFVHWMWLISDYSNPTIQNVLKNMSDFCNYLAESYPSVTSLDQLDRTIAIGFERIIKNKPIKKVVKKQYISNISMFAFWVRKNCESSSFIFNKITVKKGETPTSYLDLDKKILPQEVRDQIMIALKTEEDRLFKLYYLYKKMYAKAGELRNPKEIRMKIIYCQVLKFLMLTGRRISQVLLLGPSPLLEPKIHEARGIWVIWNESKTDQGQQSVFVPEPTDEILRNAIKITNDLKSDMIERSPHLREAVDKYLFINDNHKNKNGTVKYNAFVGWLKHDKKTCPSLMRRYNITHEGKLYDIKTHSFRRTRTTLMRQNGAGIGTVKNDLLHRSIDMTGVYIHGDSHVKEEINDLHYRRELLGITAPLIESKEVRINEISGDDLQLWKEQGMFVQPTKYGYCVLPQQSGACPSGDPCWIGPKGKGCCYHLYGPESKAAFKKDIEIVENQLDVYRSEKPNSPFIGHLKAIIERYEHLVNEIDNADQRGNGNV